MNQPAPNGHHFNQAPAMQVPQQMPQQPAVSPMVQPNLPWQGQAPAQTQSPTEPGFDVNAWAAERQINVADYGGPAGLLDTLMRGVDQAAALQQQLEIAQQAQQVQAPTAAEGSPDWRQYERFLTQGPNGEIVPVQGAEFAVPVGALKAANQEQSQRKETLESLLSNPADYMQQHLGDFVKQQAIEAWKQQQAEQEQNQTIEEYLTRNAGLLYVPGPDGKPSQTLSPKGERLVALAEQFKGQGYADGQVFTAASQALENEIYRDHLQSQQELQQVQQQMQAMQSHPQFQQAMWQHHQQQAAAQQPQMPQGARFQQSQMPQPPTQQGHLFQNPQQQVPPQNSQPPQNFLEDRGLSPQGAPGSWNTQNQQESPSIDEDVERDPEDILKNELAQRGVGDN